MTKPEQPEHKRKKINIYTYDIKVRKDLAEKIKEVTINNEVIKIQAGKQHRFIVIEDEKGRMLQKFLYDESITKLKSEHGKIISKRANHKAIRKYYQSISPYKYSPTTKEEFKDKVKKIEKKPMGYNTKEYPFSRIIFAGKDTNINEYVYVYVRVTVRIYFDGFSIDTTGRSDYFPKDTEQNKLRQFSQRLKNKIGKHPKDNLNYNLNVAVLRALAPYGSNLDFDILGWEYAYYQRK